MNLKKINIWNLTVGFDSAQPDILMMIHQFEKNCKSTSFQYSFLNKKYQNHIIFKKSAFIYKKRRFIYFAGK